jgi:hypothetical protein
MRMSKFLAIPVGMAALLALGAANAGVYQFEFTGGGLSGSGQFTTSGTTSPYLVIGITGTTSDQSYFLSTAPSPIRA